MTRNQISVDLHLLLQILSKMHLKIYGLKVRGLPQHLASIVHNSHVGW